MKIFLSLILISLSFSAHSAEYHWKVIEVTDGDTLRVETPFLPKELKLSVRVNNIDTPEKGSKSFCVKEAKLAESATKLTKKLISESQDVTFSSIKWDKYGGRVLANVNVDGSDLATSLIKAGVAREYHGEKKKSWCK